ncbi:helix-turn-helix domain-containing protein [Selenomonas sp. F0473]|uniref:helix-turn-helix domain-containing protein n=1 Tax=Selenomonas sp. F0473 TaxID=999423 RepID=UPI0025EE822A|nr:helix-turn-helix transcriptional regulator [Selenomonas sp. F0473]
MAFVKSDAAAEARLLHRLIREHPEAKRAHDEFIRQIELQRMLIEARKAEHLTQEDVAQKSGLTQQAVSRMERGDGMTMTSFFKYLSGIGYGIRLEKAGVP